MIFLRNFVHLMNLTDKLTFATSPAPVEEVTGKLRCPNCNKIMKKGPYCAKCIKQFQKECREMGRDVSVIDVEATRLRVKDE